MWCTNPAAAAPTCRLPRLPSACAGERAVCGGGRLGRRRSLHQRRRRLRVSGRGRFACVQLGPGWVVLKLSSVALALGIGHSDPLGRTEALDTTASAAGDRPALHLRDRRRRRTDPGSAARSADFSGCVRDLDISAGWTGGLQTSGPAAAPFVRCQVIHATPRMGGDRLWYEVSSDREFSQFVDVGEYYVSIVRRAGSGDRPIQTEVKVWSRTATDEHYEMWDSTGIVSLDEQQISVAASPDNRTFAFSAVTVPMTYHWTIDPDAAVTWALVQEPSRARSRPALSRACSRAAVVRDRR